MKIVKITKGKHEIEPIPCGHQMINSEYGGLNNIGRDLEKKSRSIIFISFQTLIKSKKTN
jgi:hypothetical protein